MSKLASLRGPGAAVLALAFLVLFVGGGGRHAIGLVLKPMAEALIWDRTFVGVLIAVFMVTTSLTMVAVGRLADRGSPVWILVAGMAISAAGVGGMAVVETPWQALLCYGVVFAVGNGAVSITPVGVMLTRQFGGRAGLANSIAIAGMGLGQLAILSGLSVVMAEAGWRQVFLWLAVINLAAAPILLLGLNRRRTAAPPPDATAASIVGDGLVAAARTRRFWILLGAYAICGLQDFFVSAHVVAFALDQGIGPLFAGNLLAFMGLAGLVGVLLTGLWSDRAGPAWPTAACFALRLAIFGLILATDAPAAIAVFAMAYGVTYWVTAPLTVLFVRDLFGARNLGMLSGVVTMTHHIAGGLGALAGARLFDRDGDYGAAFLLMAVCSIGGAALALALHRHRRLS